MIFASASAPLRGTALAGFAPGFRVLGGVLFGGFARGFARGFAGGFAILLTWAGLAGAGLAQAAGPSLEDRVRNALNAQIGSILTSECIDPAARRPYDVTYLGLPKGDPHLTADTRDRINARLEHAIRTSGLAINVNAAENAGVAAPVLARTAEGGRQLERLVNRLYGSTFAIAVQASRPDTDVARLRISIFARGADGSYGCNRTVGIDVRLPDLTVIKDPLPYSDDLVELEGAYRLALTAVAPKLAGAEALRLQTRMGLAGQCALIDRAEDTFASTYFELKEGALASWLDGASLPPLRIGAGAGDGNGARNGVGAGAGDGVGATTMVVDFELLEPSRPIIDVTIAVASANGIETRRQFQAVVHPERLRGCHKGAGLPAFGGLDTGSDGGAAPAPDPARDVIAKGADGTAQDSPAQQLVIIANRNYRYTEPVRFAQNDAAAIEKLYAEHFGHGPNEIARYDDLTQGELAYLFGAQGRPGVIDNMITKPNTHLTIYFAGHGSRAFLSDAPDTTPYLLGVDSRADRLDLTGYSLDLLVAQLARLRREKMPQGTITLILESCFSGQSNDGDLVKGVSAAASGPAPVLRTADGIILVAAALPDEVAVWDSDYRQSLFTDAYVSALYGEADQARFGGNGDGQITAAELKAFLQSRVARRIKQVRPAFRQTPQVAGVGDAVVLASIPADSFGRSESAEREHFERLTAREILAALTVADIQPYLRNCIYCPLQDELRAALKRERRREAICRAEDRHARQLLETGTAVEIQAFFQRRECDQHTAALEARLNTLASRDLQKLQDAGLWAEAEGAGTIDAYWYYVENCESCDHKAEGRAKIDGICSRAQASVAAQFPQDKSRDGLLRYLASCNDVPAICGPCARMEEAQGLVADIESRPDFVARVDRLRQQAETPDAAGAVGAVNPERAAYQRAVDRGTWKDFETFLAAYPKSVYTAEIKERMLRLLQEESDWQDATALHQIPAYQGYIDRYPGGGFVSEARRRILLLEDEADWQTALMQRSQDSLQTYLHQRPNGAYAETARQLLRDLPNRRE